MGNKLPSYILIGCPKCASTTIYNMLNQHPLIKPAKRKELMFFSKESLFNRGLGFYKCQFDNCKDNEITGEATPDYIYFKEVPKRVKLSLPKVNLLVSVRNPITRTYSHFYGYLRKCKLRGEKPLSKELGKFIDIIIKNPEIKVNHRGKNFLEKSIYIRYLEKWMKYFPKEQFKIICFEDLVKNPIQTIQEVFVFLNLPKTKIKKEHWLKTTESNKRTLGIEYYSLMTKKTKDFLREYYRPYNEQLYKLIGRNLGWEK